MKRKNIIFIMTDEQRSDSLSCVGNPIVRTPNLDALAKEGSFLENMFCDSPLCVPSRVSLFTGQYVNRNGSYSNAVKHHVKPGKWTLVEELKKQGYKIGLAGKNHTFDNAYMEQWFDYRQEYFHFGKTHGDINEKDREVLAYYSGCKREGLIEGAAPFREEEWPIYRIAEDGLRFLEQHSGEPFFLYYSFPDPHWPNTVCEPYYSMVSPESIPDPEAMDISWMEHPFAHQVQAGVNGFERYTLEERKRILAIYYGQIAFIDKCVGMLIERLKELGLYEDTILVFSADHGNYAGRYGLLGKTGGFCDALLRIPCIIKLPGSTGGQHVSAQTSNIDIVPTLMEYMNWKTPETVQGVSFLEVLEGERKQHRREIYAEVRNCSMPPAVPELKNLEAFDDYAENMRKEIGDRWFIKFTMYGRAAMLRKEGWKYCFYTGDREELYHLETDVYEINNLAYHPEVRKQKEEMKNRLFAWLLSMPGMGRELMDKEFF